MVIQRLPEDFVGGINETDDFSAALVCFQMYTVKEVIRLAEESKELPSVNVSLNVSH